MKTVLITGTSSGIGKETAILFHKKGWNVLATMRNIEDGKDIADFENLRVLPCDVTETVSIQGAIDEGIRIFGKIDVLVNNAGYYALGPFEFAQKEQISKQINTNLLGVMEMTREIIPHFRAQNSGVIVNVSSIAGVTTVPLQTIYHATKWGVEGFSESLQHELRQFNIRVKVIEPGVIHTDFYGRSMTILQNPDIHVYDPYVKKVCENIIRNSLKGSTPDGVAKTIYRAATDNKTKLRYPTGKSKELTLLGRLLPQKTFAPLVRGAMEKS